MKSNPYEPLESEAEPVRHCCQLNGFVLGARDGAVFSAVVLALLIPVVRPYYESISSVVLSCLWIPVAWVFSAGCVAEMQYRRRVPDRSQRSWLSYEAYLPTDPPTDSGETPPTPN